MYLILRNKFKFFITEKTEDKKWIYLKGNCKELLNRETTICLENTFTNQKRIID